MKPESQEGGKNGERRKAINKGLGKIENKR